MTIRESLISLSSYPIADNVIDNIISSNGLIADEDATVEVRQSKAYNLAMIAVYDFLSVAPTISQGGVTISLSADNQKIYADFAASIRQSLGIATSKVKFGYKGSKL